MYCLWKSLFSFLSVLSSTITEWVAVLFSRVCEAIILQECVCFCPWLTFSFFLSFSLSSSVLVPARPFLFNSILLFLRHSESYSEKMYCIDSTHPESSALCNKMCSLKNFKSRQHGCPSLQLITKGNPSSFWILTEVVQVMSKTTPLNVCLDRCKSDHKKRPWQVLKDKSDLTLTVFLTKVYINIRCCRWE
jgi:hypothetical protein